MSEFQKLVFYTLLQLAVYYIIARILFLLFIEKEFHQSERSGDKIPAQSPVLDPASLLFGNPLENLSQPQSGASRRSKSPDFLFEPPPSTTPR
ncbi:MAG: hypothetical protein U1B80_05180 [Anaerolineaceae bacterium]|nr:hypothetical protein [Anaerolineaceae bacterium]